MVYNNAVKPENGADWSLRLQLSLLLPSGRKQAEGAMEFTAAWPQALEA